MPSRDAAVGTDAATPPPSDATTIDAVALPDVALDSAEPRPDASTDTGRDASAADARADSGVPVDRYACAINGVTISGSTRPAGYEFIRPAGFFMRDVTWASQFNGRAFGEPISYLAPIGSFSVGDNDAAGMYITIPFRPEPGRPYHLEWYEAQPVSMAGYSIGRRATTVFVSISPCAGDLRPHNRTSLDPWLRGCRRQSSQSILSFSTDPAAGCPLVAGETYWLTIMMADASDGLTPTEHSCASGRDRCEANFDLN